MVKYKMSIKPNKKNNKIIKPWKIINKIPVRDTNACIKLLKKNKRFISPWIINIFKKKNYSYNKFKKPIILFRVKLSDFGFKTPTTLNKFYKKIDNKYSLVHPAIALYVRDIYDEQKTGEWLRFATPMKSMIDTDGVPHLPKLGKALKSHFIETYWSYPKAIFHPHNEFIVQKK
jgi:hypothetical protein